LRTKRGNEPEELIVFNRSQAKRRARRDTRAHPAIEIAFGDIS
jgi:hypothetical protein